MSVVELGAEELSTLTLGNSSRKNIRRHNGMMVPLDVSAATGCIKCQKELDTGKKTHKTHENCCPRKDGYNAPFSTASMRATQSHMTADTATDGAEEVADDVAARDGDVTKDDAPKDAKDVADFTHNVSNADATAVSVVVDTDSHGATFVPKNDCADSKDASCPVQNPHYYTNDNGTAVLVAADTDINAVAAVPKNDDAAALDESNVEGHGMRKGVEFPITTQVRVVPLNEAAATERIKCQKELDTGEKTYTRHDEGCPRRATRSLMSADTAPMRATRSMIRAETASAVGPEKVPDVNDREVSVRGKSNVEGDGMRKGMRKGAAFPIRIRVRVDNHQIVLL